MRRLYFIKSNISTLSGFKLTRCSTIRLEILNSLSDAMEPMGAERYRLANEDSRGNFCWLPAHQEKGHLSRGMFFSLRYSVTSHRLCMLLRVTGGQVTPKRCRWAGSASLAPAHRLLANVTSRPCRSILGEGAPRCRCLSGSLHVGNRKRRK